MRELNGIFSGSTIYADKWQVVNRRTFTPEEIKCVESAKVVPSSYGNSVCFMMVGGGMTFFPLSRDSSLGVGESVDLSKAEILTLSKQGEKDIVRIEA